MRDVNRLGIMISLFAQIWHKHSDMRFGQLVINIHSKMEANYVIPFAVEDDIWEQTMRDILTNGF